MLVEEFMKIKGKVAFSRAECNLLKISYPLSTGWKKLELAIPYEDALRLIGEGKYNKVVRRGLKRNGAKRIEKLNNELRSLVTKGVVGKIRTGLPTLKEQQMTDDFYKSDAWLKLRYRVLTAHKQLCMLCGRTPNDCGSSLHVDHIVPRSLDKNKELEFENCQLLCRDCNLGKSNLDTQDFRPRKK